MLTTMPPMEPRWRQAPSEEADGLALGTLHWAVSSAHVDPPLGGATTCVPHNAESARWGGGGRALDGGQVEHARSNESRSDVVAAPGLPCAPGLDRTEAKPQFLVKWIRCRARRIRGSIRRPGLLSPRFEDSRYWWINATLPSG